MLTTIAVLCAVVFMTIGAHGRWDFVLPLRGIKLATLVLVAYAIAVSTVLFQTITGNGILTPSIMGFDALYILIQTVLTFAMGASGLSRADPRLMFGLQVTMMTVFSGILYRHIFSGTNTNLHLTLLTGVVCGMFFASLSSFLQRLIAPNDFVVLQDRFFANFNSAQPALLVLAAVIVCGVTIVCWKMRHSYDVVQLGREAAISLGVDYRRVVSSALMLVAILVSVSTALVGPVTFFGLLVANLAYQVAPPHKHILTVPAAILIATITLIAGQLVLERIFAFNTALSIIIEFLGGLVFLALLMRGTYR